MSLTRVSGQDLWQQAINRLDPQLRATLQRVKSGRRDILDAVLQEAEAKRQLSYKHLWKANINGKQVIIRDVIEKIAGWVRLFKEIGGLAVQYNPVHASLPWAAIRFLLQAAIQDTDLHEGVVGDLEMITSLLARCRGFEEHFMSGNALQTQIEDALIILYVKVLACIASAVGHFQDFTAKRLPKVPFRVIDDSVQHEILAKEEEILKSASLYGRASLLPIKAQVARVYDQTLISEARVEEVEFFELLKWLSRTPFIHEHEDISRNRIPLSGSWLLQHPDYLAWQASSSSAILLLHGIPGCGKTNLSSVVVDAALTESHQKPDVAPLAYFYCADSESQKDRRNPEDVLRSIVRQLTMSTGPQRSVHKSLLSCFDRKKARAKLEGSLTDVPRLRMSECTDLILETLDSNPATILIDAVDELTEDRRCELLDALEEIVQKSANVVKVLVTSRDDSRTFAMLPNSQLLRVSDSVNGSDIEMFARLSVDAAITSRALLQGEVKIELKEKIVSALVRTAGGMFVWVKLQLSRICRLRHQKDIEAALTDLPNTTINDLYQDTFAKIKTSGEVASSLAFRVFAWLLYVQEPLPATGIICAIAARSGSSLTSIPEIIGLCFDLVQVVDYPGRSLGSTIHFIHHSVQEFLRLQPGLSPADGHRILASCCLSICDGSLELPVSMNQYHSQALSDYAAIYWPYHVAQSDIHPAEDALYAQVTDFVFDGDDTSLIFALWLRIVEGISSSLPREHPHKASFAAALSPSRDAVFVLCMFGLRAVLLYHDRPYNYDWDLRNNDGHTPLYLASSTADSEVVRFLIGKGAHVNIECGNHGSPLHVACFRGFEPVVNMLLTRGAEIATGKIFGTAVHAAIRGDHEDLALSLLVNWWKPTLQADQDSISSAAMTMGFPRVIKLLQKTPGYRPLSPEKHKLSVTKAIAGGRTDSLLSFLKDTNKGLELFPDDSVAVAAANGHQEAIKSLLNAGLLLEAPGILGTPLRNASLFGHEPSVRVLLDYGADVNRNTTQGNALHAAAMRGNTNIVKLLIRSGADVNLHGDYYGTALQAAAFYGHEDVVRHLIDGGADVRARGYAIDAFHAAAEGGHQEVVKLMLDRGFPILGSPLATRSMRSFEPRNLLAEFQFAKPTSDRDHDDSNSSPELDTSKLLSSIDSGSARKLQFIRTSDRPATWNRRDGDYSYALEIAARHGHSSVVRQILDSKDQLKLLTSNQFGVTNALAVAIRNDQRDTVETILRFEQISAAALQSSLNIATSHGKLSIIEVIINGYTSKDVTFEALGIALTHASLDGCAIVVKTLFQSMGERASQSKMQEVMPRVLEKAAFAGDIDTVMTILSSSCPISRAEIESALLQASFSSSAAIFLAVAEVANSLLPYVQLVGQCLLNAASNGRVSVLNAILATVDVQSLDTSAMKVAVWHAAAAGHTSSVELLLGATRAADLQSSRRQALDLAVRHEHLETLLYLLIDKIDLEIPSHFPLLEEHQRTRSVEDLQRLFRRRVGFDMSDLSIDAATDDNHELSAIQACFEGFPINGTQLYDTEVTPLHFATDYIFDASQNTPPHSRESLLKLLVENGADVNSLGGGTEYPLCIAAKVCSAECVAWLIDRGADVNLHVGELTVLETAMSREIESLAAVKVLSQTDQGNSLTITTVRKLLDISLELVNVHGLASQSLHDFVTKGPGGVIQYLLQYDAGLLAHGTKFGILLQMAATVGEIRCVKLLIERDVDVNFLSLRYGTALQAACYFGHKDIVNTLLEAGANPNIVKGEYRTALRAAIKSGRIEITEVLLKHPGIQVDLMSRSSKRTSSGQLAPNETYSRQYDTLSELDEDSEDDVQRVFARTALQLAVADGHAQLALMLLAAGAEITAVQFHKPYLLITACSCGSLDLIENLLLGGADVNVQDSRGRKQEQTSAMNMAIAHGALDIAQLLLRHGFNARARLDDDHQKPSEPAGYQRYERPYKKHYQTPLEFAASSGRHEILRALLQHTEFSFEEINAALFAAIRAGNIPILKTLLYHAGFRKDRFDCPDAIITAGSNGHCALMEILLDESSSDELRQAHLRIPQLIQAGMDSAVELMCKYLPCDSEVLIAACIGNRERLVSFAITEGVDPNSTNSAGYLPLHTAACCGRLGVVTFLLEHGSRSDVRCDRLGSVVRAAMEGFTRTILSNHNRFRTDEHLRSRLGPVCEDIQLICGYPRLWARPAQIRSAYHRIVEKLIEHGAPVETEPGPLGTALHLAAISGDEGIFNLLLEHGADVHASAGHFGTVSLAACNGGNSAIIKTTLGAIDTSTDKLSVALVSMCRSKNIQSVKILLDHGANVNGPDDQGQSPLSLALAIANCVDYGLWSGPDLLDVLLQHGNDLIINEADLTAAISRDGSFGMLFRKLLQHDSQVTVSEQLMIECVRRTPTNKESVAFVLEAGRLERVTANLVEAVQDVDVLNKLLDYDPRFQISPDLIRSARTVGCMRALLERAPDIVTDERMVEHALCLPQKQRRRFGDYGWVSIDFLWDYNPELRVTETMLIKAGDAGDFETLLRHADPRARLITADVVDARLQSGDRLKGLLNILEFDPTVELTTAQVMVPIKIMSGLDIETLKLYLLRHRDPQITEEIFCAAFERYMCCEPTFPWAALRQQQFMSMLEKFTKKVQLTPKVRALIRRVIEEDDDGDIADEDRREIRRRLNTWFVQAQHESQSSE